MSSIGDILKNKSFKEPAEIAIIKNFVKDKYQSSVSVAVRENQITISAPNAALAGTLRHDSQELSQLCQTKKRLVFRIG